MNPHKSNPPDGQQERLDAAERWMADGLRVSEAAGFFVTDEIDMSRSRMAIQRLRDDNIKATYTHVFVHAAAIALARNPDLHYLVVGTRRYVPNSVDIGLSVSGSSVVAPVLVIKQANKKSLRQIAQEVIEKTPQVRSDNERMLSDLKGRGWLVPFGWLRRFIIRTLMRDLGFRRRGVGTFQVSCLKDVDQFAPLLVAAGAILGTGRVRERVVAVDKTTQVRPTVIVTCCADHKVWDGARASKFLHEVKGILESDGLD